MLRSESIAKLAAALAKAQRALKAATKDSENPHFHSRYADLAANVEACREPLAANEIAVLQSPSADGNLVRMTTMLVHSSGEWLESDLLQVQARDAAPQAVGSCLTYLRRYQLAAMVGIAPEDDDAEAAEGRPKPETPKPAVAPKPAAVAPRPAPKAQAPKPTPKPNGGTTPEPPPLTDKDIPFAWALPLLLPLAGMLG